MIAIIGSGMAGMFAARALSRLGRPVTLFEADAPTPFEGADSAFAGWQRPGVAQLRQPHAARAIIRKLLQQRDAPLLQAMIDAGMVEWNFHLLALEDPAIGHDPELVGLLGRRPTLEGPLRSVVEKTPGVTIVREPVRGLLFEGEGGAKRVAGVLTDSGAIRFDTVIEASGRRSKISEWLEAAGTGRPHEETVNCSLAYYSRYFRFRPGVDIPRGPYPSGPSASMQGVHFTMNRTDHRTFSLMLGVAPWQEEFRGLRHEAAFMQFVRGLPGASAWLEPAVSEPIWKVEPFAGLVNRYKRFARDGLPMVEGLYVVGDARFHTNPIHGWGMSFALQTSYLLEDLFRAVADPRERQARFEQQADAHAWTYYKASAAEDDARAVLWKKEIPLSVRGEAGSYRHFLTTIIPASFKDQWIFRKVTRRLHLLDGPEDILADEEVMRRAERIGATLNQSLSADQLVAMAVEAAAPAAQAV
jgi:2-polyprenyl-6-methoxyphenol hydroxylase-like FAD-dependent oxidoreductase